jgi:TonB family protein
MMLLKNKAALVIVSLVGWLGGLSPALGDTTGPGQPRIEDVVVHLPKLSGQDPQYTQRALDHDVEGVMIVKCVVSTKGAVHKCRVVVGLPFMNRAVVDALERRTYEPYVLNGVAREVDYTFRIRFQLAG